MTDLDREQLKRACADALSTVSQNKGVDGLDALATSIAELGPMYRAHGTLCVGARAESLVAEVLNPERADDGPR